MWIKDALIAAPLRKRDGGKAVVLVGVEVLIDVKSVKRGIKGRKFRTKAQATLGLGHEGEEIRNVGLVERLGQFSQNNLAPVWNFGGDHAGAVAPVIVADGDGVSRTWFIVGSWRRLL